ncbi:hypothetical protein ENSA5_02410 [Enhygromyxa salina]|uniref:Uncharacterized protein n=1 Tax=Enhygromyxa salina TaxID=215803 RepID=A0A2S9YK31_9BACT|nr:hypothetical protein [Enhygromyxa salina]PRQ05464.1 hypothetical protein ENSA5_02410 [Enhygromyxa salina]
MTLIFHNFRAFSRCRSPPSCHCSVGVCSVCRSAHPRATRRRPTSEIDRGLLCLEVDGWQCPCRRLRPGDDGPAAVHYVGFSIPEPAIQAMSTASVWLRVDSTIDRRRVALAPATRASLVETLSPGDAGDPPGSTLLAAVSS